MITFIVWIARQRWFERAHEWKHDRRDYAGHRHRAKPDRERDKVNDLSDPTDCSGKTCTVHAVIVVAPMPAGQKDTTIPAMLGLPEISISAAGFIARSPSPKAAIEEIHAMGVRAITLDASAPDFRPRTLSRSARRDLAASLRRRELEFTGVDLWIPPEHFVDASNAHRAIDAVSQAAEMSSELATLVGGRSRPVVSVLLPTDMNQTDRLAIGANAQRVGAIISDHQPEFLTQEQTEHVAGISIGVDPALVLMNGNSPGKAVTHAGEHLASVRLNDLNAMGRCTVGAPGAKLDIKGYAGALIVAGQEWVTLDVREMPEPSVAYQQARQAWSDAVAG